MKIWRRILRGGRWSWSQLCVCFLQSLIYFALQDHEECERRIGELTRALQEKEVKLKDLPQWTAHKMMELQFQQNIQSPSRSPHRKKFSETGDTTHSLLRNSPDAHRSPDFLESLCEASEQLTHAMEQALMQMPGGMADTMMRSLKKPRPKSATSTSIRSGSHRGKKVSSVSPSYY